VELDLAPIAYYSRLLSTTERVYSTYEKEYLSVLFGCDKCRSYLEHKEFELHCDNLALCWLLKRVKEIGRLGRWVLRLASFKFRVEHSRRVDNVVADALSRIFVGRAEKGPEVTCAALLESLPLVYSSLPRCQADDPVCKAMRAKILTDTPLAEKFVVQKDVLCYFPKGAKRRRWVVPKLLITMLLQYFRDSPFGGHLGAAKTFHKLAENFWRPKMRRDLSVCEEVYFMPAGKTRP